MKLGDLDKKMGSRKSMLYFCRTGKKMETRERMETREMLVPVGLCLLLFQWSYMNLETMQMIAVFVNVMLQATTQKTWKKSLIQICCQQNDPFHMVLAFLCLLHQKHLERNHQILKPIPKTVAVI